MSDAANAADAGDEPRPERDLGSSGGILGVTVRRPVGVFMALLAVALFGWTSLGRLPLNLLPELSFPTLTVRTTWEGAAPEEMEERVTRPLEEGLRVVPGLVEASSVTRANTSSIRLRFAWGTDMRFAAQDVAERIQQTRNQLPRDVDAPLVLRYDPTLEPVLRLAAVGRADATSLRHYAEDELSRSLEKLEGVAAAKIQGGLEEEIHVDLSEDLLSSSGLTVQAVEARLQQENVDVAAGLLLDGDTEYLVRTANRLTSVGELEDIIVGRRGDAIIRLRDVGKVRRAARDRDVIIRVDGREGVLLEIHREAGANLVAVASSVREAVFGTAVQQAYVEKHRERLLRDKASLSRAIAATKGPPGARADDGTAGAERGADDGGKKSKDGKDDEDGEGRGKAKGKGKGGWGEWEMTPEQKQRLADRQMTAFMAWNTPDDVDLVLLEDGSVFVRDALNEVQSAVIVGGLLAILILFLFLRQLRPTLIVAISLPASVLFTFATMFLADVSLNLMSLGGLALGVGMLVDNSIVVLESITRCSEEGDDLVRATMRGTREVGSAVIASTLTTVAVFLPIIFVEGVAGQIFRDQAVTVVLSLLASLVAALFLIPMLASRRLPDGVGSTGDDDGSRAPASAGSGELPRPWTFSATRGRAAAVWSGPWLGKPLALVTLLVLPFIELVGLLIYLVVIVCLGWLAGLVLRRGGALGWLLVPITWPFDRMYRATEVGYRPLLASALRHRSATLIASVALCGYAVLLYPRLGAELLPRIHQGSFNVEASLPVTTPVGETDRVLAGMAPRLRAIPGVAQVVGVSGVSRTDLEAADEGANTGELRVKLAADRADAAGEAAVVERVREAIAAAPELNGPRIEFPELVSIESTLDVEIVEDDLGSLHATARKAARVLEDLPFLADVQAGLGGGTPEVVLQLEPEVLARHNLNRRQVAETVRAKLQGNATTRLSGARRLDIRVSLDDAELQGVEALRKIRIDQGGEGVAAVLLGDVATVEMVEGPGEIRRQRGRRIHRLSANLVPGVDLATATVAAETALDRELGPLVQFRVVGQSEELERSQMSMLIALLTAAFLVYVVMASQFESLVQPFLIVMTLPLSLVGVLTVLYAFGEPVGVVVFIGAIVLAGIVVNNAIVLVDTANRLRQRGRTAAEAAAEAGHLRLRPILMTTATTVLGLVPMLVSGGAGSEIRRPLALTVAAGLTSSTVLTLVVIPVLYAIVQGGLDRWRGETPGDGPVEGVTS